MGYTLTIGEAKIELYEEGLESSIHIDADNVTLPSAPAYNEPTDHTSSRWPSYTSWRNAMEFVGLHDLMFNKETGLIREHPGCVPIVKEHKEIIDAAYSAYKIKYPKAVAGYSPKATDLEEDPDWPKENSWMTRLEWLKFWVDWSLENCKIPVFVNS